jgi:acetyl esterase
MQFRSAPSYRSSPSSGERRETDEGEAYAAELRAAGVPVTSVRYNGTIHDFVMLNALRDTHAATAATAQGGEFLRATLWD